MFQCRLSFSFPVACLFLGLAWSVSLHSVEAGTFEASSAQEARQIQAQVRAAHFLSKATFGPTKQDIVDLGAQIESVGYRRACNNWIDEQFDIVDNPPADKLVRSHIQTILDIFTHDGLDHTVTGANVARVRHQAWWDIALRSDDQLRQRFAWAMSQIFVTSDSGAGFNVNTPDLTGFGRWIGPTRYYEEVLVDNALNLFS